jgi:HTH-type transcriptional regulator/antitoxin HigA
MEPKVIRTEDQYRSYLDELQTLVAKAPAPGSTDSDRLELLTVVIEAYENNKYPIESPDPIDAILFRMQEKGLSRPILCRTLAPAAACLRYWRGSVRLRCK